MFSALRNLAALALVLNAGMSFGAPTGVETTAADLAEHQLSKRATITCASNSTQATFLSDAYTEGKYLASNAADYVTAHGASNALYVSYFGTAPLAKVSTVLNKIGNENSDIFSLTCSGDADPSGLCAPGMHTNAYTRERWISGTSTVIDGKMYYCPQFFTAAPLSGLCANPTGYTRGSTIVHEMSHATSLTSDNSVSTCTQAQTLAVSNSTTAADTATNYSCFAREVYLQTRC